MKLFSEMLQAVLREKNLSDRWLSREIEKLCGKGITSATIGKYRKGHITPSPDNAMKIIKALNHHFKLGLTLNGIFDPEEVKNIQAKEGSVDYEASNLKREGVVEVPLFPSGAELLAAVTHSKRGYFIDVSMAREKTVVAEALAHDRVFAAKIDHLYDADDELGDAIVVWPLDAEGLKNNSIVLLANNPPSKFYIRRLALAEEDRLILKSPIDEESAIDRKDQRIIGKIKAAINFYE